MSNLLEEAAASVAAGAEPAAAAALLRCCVQFLWRVHGVDYFAGTELPPAVFDGGCERSPTAPPADAGAKAGAPWEALVDAAWARRLAEGDPVGASLCSERVQGARAAFVERSVLKKEESKYACGVAGCSKLFVSAEFVQKHISSKHAEKIEEAHEQTLDDIYLTNFARFQEAQDAAKPQRAEGEREPLRPRGGRGGRGQGGGRRHGGGGGFNSFAQQHMAMPFMPMPMADFAHAGIVFPQAPQQAYVDLDAVSAPSRQVIDYGDI
jgi:hypothetical protein